MSDEPDDDGPCEPFEFTELVMPFTVVKSVGGPYEDDAFVAGYRCGLIDHWLEGEHPPYLQQYVETSVLPQLDLIAMRRGYWLKSEASDEAPQWSLATFNAVIE